MYFDTTYVLVIIGAIISFWASSNVKNTFKAYSSGSTISEMTGVEVAESILSGSGIYDVSIQYVPGNLTDHYNPIKKTLNLSESTYSSKSISALSVAAHECGHAIQHAKGYVPLQLRSMLAPVANIGSKYSWYFIIAGLIFGAPQLCDIGIAVFSIALLFQIVTLPVEFNASDRAMKIMQNKRILQGDELIYGSKVLRAAALTYVAAVATSVLTVLRLLLLSGRRSR